MKTINITAITRRESNSKAIAIFAGWAMDGNPFMSLHRDGYDIIIVYGYGDESLDISVFSRYDEIIVIGWSMGVVYGEEFMRLNGQLPITRSVAVNGSPQPRHDTLGIPVEVYDLTARISTGRQLTKFYMRVSGGAAEMARLMSKTPDREPLEVAAELEAITRKVERTQEYDSGLWDEIWLSSRDLIFPIDNLIRAWEKDKERVTVTDRWGHLPDFGRLLEIMAVDKTLVENRFGGSMPTYGSNATVQESVARDLVAMMPKADGCEVLEIGVGSGYLTRLYQEMVTNSRITALDLVKPAVESARGNEIRAVAADAELAVRGMDDEAYDLVVSSSTIQWFNSPRRFLAEVARVLKPGGMALISTYGKGTFSCLRETAPEAALHYAPLDEGLLARAGVEGEIISKRYELEFDSPRAALDHIRLTGVNATRRSPLSVGKTRRLLEALRRDDGTASLDFEALFIKIKKPQ